MTKTRYDYDEETDPSIAIVETVSAVTGRPMTDLPPLQNTLDTDALDTILRSEADDDLQVVFTYLDLEVMARGDGTIVVESGT